MPEPCCRPGATFAHEPRSREDPGVPLGAMRSIGRTQLWGETTRPPRLSARRQTTATRPASAPGPRARRPRRRRRWSSGRALARPTRPPICKSACRGTQCPGPQNGCGGTCVVPASHQRDDGVSEHKMHDDSGRFVVYFLLTHSQLSPIPALSQPYLSPISAQSQPDLSPISALSQPYLSPIPAYLSPISALSQPYLSLSHGYLSARITSATPLWPHH